MNIDIKTCGRLFIQMLEDNARLARKELDKADEEDTKYGLLLSRKDYKEKLLKQIYKCADDFYELYDSIDNKTLTK